jgi:hypothetical protein
MTEPNPLSVFLAHAKEDKPLVLEIYHLLRLDGFLPWVDKENHACPVATQPHQM